MVSTFTVTLLVGPSISPSMAARPIALAGAFVVSASTMNSRISLGGGGGIWKVPVRSTTLLLSEIEMPTTLVGSNPDGKAKMPLPTRMIIGAGGSVTIMVVEIAIGFVIVRTLNVPRT